MYKDELQTEIAKALTTYSDLDYDVALIIASIYIVLREKQSQEDAMDYHLFRDTGILIDRHIPRATGVDGRYPRHHPQRSQTQGAARHFYKWEPTPIILMDELFPTDHPNMEKTTFVKIYDYENAFRYFQRRMIRRRNIREKAYQITRMTQHGLYKNILNIMSRHILNCNHVVSRKREFNDAVDDLFVLKEGAIKRFKIRSPFTEAEKRQIPECHQYVCHIEYSNRPDRVDF